MSDKIISILSRIHVSTEEATDDRVRAGFEFMSGLDDKTRENLLLFLFRMVETEVKIGLGVSDFTVEEREQYGNLSVFEVIDSVYDEAKTNKECYLCNPCVDANGQQFEQGHAICPDCQFKVANILQFFGVDPEPRLGLIVTPRKVQEARFTRSGGKIRF